MWSMAAQDNGLQRSSLTLRSIEVQQGPVLGSERHLPASLRYEAASPKKPYPSRLK